MQLDIDNLAVRRINVELIFSVLNLEFLAAERSRTTGSL